MARTKTQVEVILFRKVKGKLEFLLMKRIASKGGFWQPVTGGLEEGETIKEAALREIKEETGVKKVKRLIESVHYFKFDNHPKLEDEYVFGAEISQKEKIVFDKNIYTEHDDQRWCAYEDAMKLLKWSGNKEGLRKLNDILAKEK
jgi:dATP pyrophosphohydrolase